MKKALPWSSLERVISGIKAGLTTEDTESTEALKYSQPDALVLAQFVQATGRGHLWSGFGTDRLGAAHYEFCDG